MGWRLRKVWWHQWNKEVLSRQNQKRKFGGLRYDRGEAEVGHHRVEKLIVVGFMEHRDNNFIGG